MVLRRKHPVLLAAVVTMLVVQPLLAHGDLPRRILHDAMFAAIFLSVPFIIFERRGERRLALAVAFPAIAFNLAHHVLPGRLRVSSALVFNALMIVFLTFAVVVVLRDLLGKRVIHGDDIFGAITGYLLGGVVWGFLYAALHLLEPGSFDVQREIAWQLQEGTRRHALFNYFSFTTLTSLGYNDITPVTPLANTLTWLEVVFGQFYMAIVVAQLVGMKMAQALTPDPPSPK